MNTLKNKSASKIERGCVFQKSKNRPREKFTISKIPPNLLDEFFFPFSLNNEATDGQVFRAFVKIEKKI